MEIRRRNEFSYNQLEDLKEVAFVMEYTVTHDGIVEDMLYIVHPITSLTREEI